MDLSQLFPPPRPPTTPTVWFVTVSRADVKFPWGRWDIMLSLAGLADPDYQRTVWLSETFDPNLFDNFDEVVHLLYDDRQVFPEPTDAIGFTLVDGLEIERLRRLEQALTPLIDELGDVPDSVYMSDPRWAAVMALAAQALTAMVHATSTPRWTDDEDALEDDGGSQSRANRAISSAIAWHWLPGAHSPRPPICGPDHRQLHYDGRAQRTSAGRAGVIGVAGKPAGWSGRRCDSPRTVTVAT